MTCILALVTNQISSLLLHCKADVSYIEGLKTQIVEIQPNYFMITEALVEEDHKGIIFAQLQVVAPK